MKKYRHSVVSMADSALGSMCSRVPIIVILGATGSGKSKLGIELAKRFHGEIISADSMQVYRGLDVITNKVTRHERAEARHHMIDVVDPWRRFTVVDFRNLALAEMQRIHERGKLPVIVGGTNYYIESLLWKVLVEPGSDPGNVSPDQFTLMWERDPQKRPNVKDSSNIPKCDQKRSAPCDSDSSNKRPAQEDIRDSSLQISASENQNISDSTLKAKDVSDSRQHISAPTTLESPDNRDSSPISADDSSENVRDSSHISASATCDSSETISDSSTKVNSSDSKTQDASDISHEDWESMSNADLHAKLTSLDPDSAATLHPNNRRKIIRCLQVWYTEGRAMSSVLREQRSGEGGSSLGGPLRYPNSAILWLQCEQEILDKRLDDRVDTMIQQGLIQELLDFHKRYNEERLAANLAADYTAGIFQSIGLKEFHTFLVLPETERDSEQGRRMFREGVEALKLATRRYARRQVRWVVNRFLRRPDRQVPPVYGLDTTEPSRWDELVLEPASRVLEGLISGHRVDNCPTPLPIRDALDTRPCNQYCDVCDRIFVDLAQWQAHVKSKKHKRVLAKWNRDKNV